MRVLNLYAGLGGNRKHWNNCEVTAIEYTPKIAKVYRDQYPQDTVIVADAHQYLLENHQDFDFIWSSPPCQSHSRMIRSGRNRRSRYVDLKLYEEIMLLNWHELTGCVDVFPCLLQIDLYPLKSLKYRRSPKFFLRPLSLPKSYR